MRIAFLVNREPSARHSAKATAAEDVPFSAAEKGRTSGGERLGRPGLLAAAAGSIWQKVQFQRAITANRRA
jgi:hypothetical protein